MNRELKFRVWDNVDYMSSPFTLQDVQNRKIEFISNLPVMQYTGLKDNNGIEIYEGDILKCSEYDPFEHQITQTFNNAVVGFGDGNYYYYPKGNMLMPHQLLMYAYKSEVIGNIYEDAELLNVQPIKEPMCGDGG